MGSAGRESGSRAESTGIRCGDRPARYSSGIGLRVGGVRCEVHRRSCESAHGDFATSKRSLAGGVLHYLRTNFCAAKSRQESRQLDAGGQDSCDGTDQPALRNLTWNSGASDSDLACPGSHVREGKCQRFGRLMVRRDGKRWQFRRSPETVRKKVTSSFRLCLRYVYD